ncbi:Holliday junction branch migration DNA helicase RuvB [[Mycoplasma] anseris]|uniref:Holliday junction branch migration complex subunit RuvB n=1 Tax=[Mycoplasma] anseris TaxID=92400 RepID=A0A2Z4NCK9_9BACT|nr:Holliday junction branch migration DNA helicase RuvB [[Mycoplasma] anseris]AWX69225.1 Holliday junction branch migration DNA helicase RuvB [[Mycoplasma] anseris]
MKQEFKVNYFADFIGQENITKTLKVMLNSADYLKKPVDHILFYGPPGLGKTSLANIIANETKRNIIFSQGPLLERRSDLLTLLSSIKENDIIFIDEIHGMNKNLEELLYSAMEEGVVDLAIGVDGDKRIMRMKLKNFTLIGATTKFHLLSKPLKDRFGFIGKLQNYSQFEIEKIISNSSIRNKINIDKEAIKLIAESSQQTPRIANNLLKRVHDFAIYENCSNINISIVEKAFKFLGIFKYGLSNSQIEYLKILNTIFQNKTGSLDSICSLLKDDRHTIINEIEPTLLLFKLIEKSPRGRTLTKEGICYLDKFTL